MATGTLSPGWKKSSRALSQDAEGDHLAAYGLMLVDLSLEDNTLSISMPRSNSGIIVSAGERDRFCRSGYARMGSMFAWLVVS